MNYKFSGGKKFIRKHKSAIRRAKSATANEMTRAIRTEVSKSIREDWDIKAKDIKAAISITRATVAEPVAHMDFEQRRPNLAQFRAKTRYDGRYNNGVKRPVGLRYMGNGKAYRGIDHAFLLTTSSGHRLAYYRPMGASYIRALSGPSVPHLVGRDRLAMIQRMREQRVDEMFARNLKFYLSKKGI